MSIQIFLTKIRKTLVVIQRARRYMYAFLIGDYNINTKDGIECKSTLTNDFINLMSLYSYKKLICVTTRVINNYHGICETKRN